MNISIEAEKSYKDCGEEEDFRIICGIDIFSFLKLKPTVLTLRNLYFSGPEYMLLVEYIGKYKVKLKEMSYCFIDYYDQSFYKDRKSYRKIDNRFELLDI